MGKKKVTSTDIARAAGVSQSTVHIPTLAPDEAHYPEALHADIRREAERLSMLENPTPENTKRLAQLLEAAKALSERPQDARAIAEGLYGLT